MRLKINLVHKVKVGKETVYILLNTDLMYICKLISKLEGLINFAYKH